MGAPAATGRTADIAGLQPAATDAVQVRATGSGHTCGVVRGRSPVEDYLRGAVVAEQTAWRHFRSPPASKPQAICNECRTHV